MFPLLEHCLQSGILLNDRPCKGVGKEGGGERDCILFVDVADIGEGLYQEPCGIVGIFYRQTRSLDTFAFEQLLEVELQRPRLVLRERQGSGDILLVGQHGKVVLLTIAESIALCYDTHDQESFLTFKQ